MCLITKIKLVQIPQGKWIDAIDSLTVLINVTKQVDEPINESRLIELYNLRAECHYRLHEYNASRHDCDRVLKCDSNNIEANERKVKCLFGLKQYQLADEKIQQLTKSTSTTSTSSSTNSPYESLILLQKRIRLEQKGVFDIGEIREECAQLFISDEKSDSGSEANSEPELCGRLGPHGEYIHPGIQFVPVDKKGYGLKVKVTIPNKGALITGSKAIFVHLGSDQRSELEMFKRKLKDQPDLILQVQRLFSKPQYAQKRFELIKQINPIELMNRAISMESNTNAPNLNDVSDQQLEDSYEINRFGNDGGTGLGFLPSLFNHSCLRNCRALFIGDFLFVRSVTPILSGSELTISYQGDMKLLSFSKRRTLLRGWFDRCGCELCQPFHEHPELIQLEDELVKTTTAARAAFDEGVEVNTVTSSQLMKQVEVLDEAIDGWIDAIRRVTDQSESDTSSSSDESTAESDVFDSTLSISLVKPYRLQRALIQHLVTYPSSNHRRLTDRQIRQWQSRSSRIWHKLQPILKTYHID